MLIIFLCLFLPIQSAVIDKFPLHIVHYNDFHARFEETAVQFPVCNTKDSQCLGGFARLYYEINALAKEFPDTLVLNAGDVFQGTYWYTLMKWNVTQNFINMLPTDVHTLGNHEFDDGVADLTRYIAALKAPVVAANVDLSLEPSLQDLIQPHVIIKKNGHDIGVIGLITPETATSSSSGGVIFLDPIAVVKKEAQSLKDKGVEIIVVLSHCGLDVDEVIAKEAGENVDVIVGGHSHSLLWNGTSPSHEKVSGPYPVLVKSAQNSDHNVLIVTASSFTKYLGNITVFFDKNGEISDFDGSPVFLNRSIPEDPEILALMEPYKKTLYALVGEEIGFSNETISDFECAAQECALGNIAADAFRQEALQNYPTNLTSIAFLLRNNIRNPLPVGRLTRAAVLNIFPFSNKMVVLEIEGKYILEALQRTMSKSYKNVPFAGPWVPQISGMRVVANTTMPRNITSVMVKEDDVYVPLDMNKFYQLATLDFLAEGGSGYTMLKQHARNPRPADDVAKIFEKSLNSLSPIVESEYLDGRLILQ